jgi:hypothetical protein
MRSNVVHTTQGQPETIGERLAERRPDGERADQPRSVRNSDPVEFRRGQIGPSQCFAKYATYPSRMRSTRDLRHDPIVRRVLVDLSSDYLAPNRSTVSHDSDRAFVT